MSLFNYHQPTQIHFGAGEIEKIGQLVAAKGKRCLVVTEAIFPAVQAAYDNIFSLLRKQGLTIAHFDGVVPNPPTQVVEAGCTMAREQECDVVLAIGGGSSIDTAKVIAAAVKVEEINWPEWFNRYDSPFGDIAPLPAETLPLIAVPTTSGTGSQVTHAAVITNTEEHAKLTLFHPEFYPCDTVVDPNLMLTLPSRMTAMTGFDAFSHAFESFTGSRPSPFVDALALQAMELIIRTLPKVVDDGSDIEGRSKLATADTFAGIALANGGAGAPHPMGEILGSSKSDLPHGLTLAVVYPAYLAKQWRRQPERYARVAELFGATGSTEEKAKSLASCVTQFLIRIGLETNLNQVGVSQKDLDEILPAFRFDLPLTSGKEMQEMLQASLV